jgi:hypothetical protein
MPALVSCVGKGNEVTTSDHSSKSTNGSRARSENDNKVEYCVAVDGNGSNGKETIAAMAMAAALDQKIAMILM